MSEQDQSESALAPSPSRTLLTARESLGMSQKEVADRLYLTTAFIRYIDDGEFDRLPKKAFIKGYLRSYAKVVGLSGDDVVAMYDVELEAQEPAPKMKGVTDEQVGSASITGPVMQTGVIALIVFVLVVGGIWYLVTDSEDSSAVTVTQPSVTQPAQEDSPNTDFGFVLPAGEAEEDASVSVIEAQAEAASSVNEQEGQVDSGNDTRMAESIPETIPETTPESVPGADETGAASGPAATAEVADTVSGISVSASDEPAIERTSDGVRNFIKVDAGGFDQLELSFPDECWVEVEDDQIGLVYSDLNRSGDVLTVYGTAPFNVLLGKATGVEMLYNGRPFDLAPFVGQDDTAKVTVNE